MDLFKGFLHSSLTDLNDHRTNCFRVFCCASTMLECSGTAVLGLMCTIKHIMSWLLMFVLYMLACKIKGLQYLKIVLAGFVC